MAIANMSLRFPQAVRPLGEPLALLENQIRLSQEIADYEHEPGEEFHDVIPPEYIPDWDPAQDADGPASKKTKQGEPAPTQLDPPEPSPTDVTSESETTPNSPSPEAPGQRPQRVAAACPVVRELRLMEAGTYAQSFDDDLDWNLQSETAALGLITALEQQKRRSTSSSGPSASAWPRVTAGRRGTGHGEKTSTISGSNG